MLDYKNSIRRAPKYSVWYTSPMMTSKWLIGKYIVENIVSFIIFFFYLVFCFLFYSQILWWYINTLLLPFWLKFKILNACEFWGLQNIYTYCEIFGQLFLSHKNAILFLDLNSFHIVWYWFTRNYLFKLIGFSISQS